MVINLTLTVESRFFTNTVHAYAGTQIVPMAHNIMQLIREPAEKNDVAAVARGINSFAPFRMLSCI